MAVKLITFKTNQTIIASVVAENDERITVKETVQVIVQPSKDGPMMGFSPFLEYAQEFKTGISFDVSDILCITSPVTELENEYSKLFGSGIQIASSIPKF
jgi:hypothetical protein